MFKLDNLTNMTDEERLRYMLHLTKSQISSEEDSLANLSNITGIIYACIARLNWAGFYIMREGILVLGPFQGKPACNRIELGKGVCGTAARLERSILVGNVNEFPGHIFCDGDSLSELVVPIIKDGRVLAVLDLDSPELNRFTELEKKYFEELAGILKDSLNWEYI